MTDVKKTEKTETKLSAKDQERYQNNEDQHISKQLADLRDSQLAGNRVHPDGTFVKEVPADPQKVQDEERKKAPTRETAAEREKTTFAMTKTEK